MTRIRKSRKPAASSVPRTEREATKQKAVVMIDKKPKKQTGNQPGARQQVAHTKQQHEQNSTQKDPRLGSKKPIALGVAPTKIVAVKPKTIKSAPMAAVQRIVPQADLWQEYEQLSEDPQLLDIVDKQTQELTLTEAEVDYFNEKMDRYQQLQQLLGIDDDDAEESLAEQSTLSEEQLWQKFDTDDFDKSDY